jgi:c-di-GMP-binding flagellar brake protein YcgR
MNWDKALAMEMIMPQMCCSLIIVGETKEGMPFCYEGNFTLQKVNAAQLEVTLELQTMNPLEQLQQVCFIEVSFRERGVLYYAFVNLLHLSTEHNVCTMTMSSPQELNTFQNRRFTRIRLPDYTPLTCKIVGTRMSSTHEGITYTGHILDLSAGGLSFVTNTRIFYPLFLELSFILPGHPHQYVVQGEISRVSQFNSDSYRIAVEFRNIPEKLIHLIDDYCSQPTCIKV